MSEMMSFDEVLKVLMQAKRGSYDLDKLAWGRISGNGAPLPHYANDWFDEARRSPDLHPEARLTTDPAAAILFLEQTMPGVDWRLEHQHGEMSFTASGEHADSLVYFSEQARKIERLPVSEVALCLGRAAVYVYAEKMTIERHLTASPGL